MTDNVFEADQTTNAEQTSVEATQTDNTFISELVGDGKKFKDIDALAKGKLEADKFIEHLQQEMSELRSELSSKATTEEILKSLKKEDNTNSPNADENQHGIARPEDIANIVREQINQAKSEDIAKANVNEAHNALIEKLGSHEKAVAFLKEKADGLGLPVSRLQQIAAESPKALYGVLGMDSVTQQTHEKSTSVKSNVNSEAVPTNPGQLTPGTKAYFDAIRKEDKRKYFTSEIQDAIFKAKKAGTYESR